jgi:tetratricopeptide (TPR) repeat protein
MKYITTILLVLEVILPSLYAQNPIPLGKSTFFDSMYYAAHTVPDTQKIVNFCNISSMFLTEDLALSERFCDTAEMYWRKSPTQNGQLRIIEMRGDIAEIKGQLESAYNFYKQAVPIAKAINRYEKVSDLQRRIGYVLDNLDRYEEALQYYEEAFVLP